MTFHFETCEVSVYRCLPVKLKELVKLLNRLDELVKVKGGSGGNWSVLGACEIHCYNL